MEKNAVHDEAKKLWYDFKTYIKYKNRFFISHPVLDVILKQAEHNTIIVPTGTIYFRARIIDENMFKDHMLFQYYDEATTEVDFKSYYSHSNLFRGLTKEASFIPPDENKIQAGRANPKFIRYLYVAEEPITALKEVRPLIFNNINLAEIQVKESLKIANLSVNIDTDSIEQNFDKYLLSYIQGAFSIPTNKTDDYLPTQIISEYIKNIGYDGVRFNSSLHRLGVNLTIYNCEKCEAISSREFVIEDIKISARAKVGSEPGKRNFLRIIDDKEKNINWEKTKNNDLKK